MAKDDRADPLHYKRRLYALQVQLVKLQRELIADGRRVLVILEGRDAAGKDGTIKRLNEHMSPRETRVHAPGKPSDRGGASGISSASCRICLRPGSSWCSIAPGTTAPVWSG